MLFIVSIRLKKNTRQSVCLSVCLGEVGGGEIGGEGLNLMLFDYIVVSHACKYNVD